MRYLYYSVLALTVVFVLTLIWPGIYIYEKSPAANTVIRVNRFTGVTEKATEDGWMTEAQETRAAMRKLTLEQQQDMAQLLQAAKKGQVARVFNSSGQLEVTFTDGTSRSYTLWPNTGQSILAALKESQVPVSTTY
jgi:hypothetical protein